MAGKAARRRFQGACIAVLATLGALVPTGEARAQPVELRSKIRAAEAPADAVAWQSAGDSYSSGEGVAGNKGPCAQSNDAYGPRTVRQLEADGWTFASTSFTACTGHLAEQLFGKVDGKQTLWEWGQEQGAPEKLDVIAMSFGGNDIGFADLLLDCLAQTGVGLGSWVLTKVSLHLPNGCDTPKDTLSQYVDWLLDPTQACSDTPRPSYECDLDLGDRRGSIVDLYADIVAKRLTPTGQLYVVGYPQLFAPTDEWPWWSQAMCSGVSRGAAQKITAVAHHLDEKLKEAVQRANQGLPTDRVFFVDRLSLYADGSHDLCGSGEDWLNGLAVSRGDGTLRLQSSFHPNAAGHSQTANLLEAVVQRHYRGLSTTAVQTAPGEWTFAFDHPSWGRTRVVVHGRPEVSSPGPVSIEMFDAKGQQRWSWSNTFMYYRLEPAGTGGLGDDPTMAGRPAVDDVGHLFFNWDPGRYNGVTVLAPTADGFESFGTLPAEDDYASRFYSASVVDNDGTYAIKLAENDCTPSCAGGLTTYLTYRWNGEDYVPDPGPNRCGDVYLSRDTDQIATSVVVENAPCSTASSLIYDVAQVHSFYTGPRSFTSGDFTCEVETEDDVIPVGRYRCSSGDIVVTWAQS